MDTPIAKKALFAQTRVQQALDAGAHYIDADDVREALDGFKGAFARIAQLAQQQEYSLAAYREQCEAVSVLKARNIELEQQLAEAQARVGGSQALVKDAITIKTGLADYFRYVAEAIPFDRRAEADGRGAAIVSGLSRLIQDLENSRLSAQGIKAQRDQLEGELAEARLALDVSQGQVNQLSDEFLEAYLG